MGSNRQIRKDNMVFCPILGKKMDDGLCWELANHNLGDGKNIAAAGNAVWAAV